MLLPIAILLLPFYLFFSELTCANIIIDKWDMSYKLTFHLFLFCKRIRTKYKASAHCRNGDEYGAFFDAENRVMTWKMKQEEIAWHMNMATIAHLKLTSRISENLKKVFERIGIGSKDDFGNPYEEWFISDYDVYGGRLPWTCVSRIGLMPGAAFGLPLHSFHFQKIKKFAFLKATSCIYY